MKILLILLVSFSLQILRVSSHGRLIDPPSRTSAWRVLKGQGFPPEYSDSGTSCGGKENYHKQGGKCGICGDPYQKRPRKFEAPGKYATGKMTKTYTKGQTIKVTIQVTADHRGTMQFLLCDSVPSKKKDPDQACFNKHALQLANESGDKWKFPPGNAKHSVSLKLPSGVTCDHCMLQWRWETGNHWGTNPKKPKGDGRSCVGCGQQEWFIACADIKITGSGGNGGDDGGDDGGDNGGGGTGTCPSTHPFAYYNGKWCCQTDKDENDQQLKLTSKSCQWKAYKQCPKTTCKNHPGPTGPNDCENKKQHCDYWKGQGFCTKEHVNFMKTYCKKSCTFC